MGQSISAAYTTQSEVFDINCFDGVLVTSVDPVLGNQKYMRLQPGCDARLESSEDAGGDIILMISVTKGTGNGSQLLRLTYDGRSLASTPNDNIYVITVIDDIPSIASLTQLEEIRNRRPTLQVGGRSRQCGCRK